MPERRQDRSTPLAASRVAPGCGRTFCLLALVFFCTALNFRLRSHGQDSQRKFTILPAPTNVDNAFRYATGGQPPVDGDESSSDPDLQNLPQPPTQPRAVVTSSQLIDLPKPLNSAVQPKVIPVSSEELPPQTPTSSRESAIEEEVALPNHVVVPLPPPQESWRLEPSTASGLQPQWTSIEQIEGNTVSRRIFEDRNPTRVSIGDILARMLTHSRQLQQLQIQPAEARQLVNLEYGAFDPNVFVNSQFDVQNVQVKRERNLVTTGLRKNHIYGGRLELSQALGVQDNVVGFTGTDQGTAALSVIYAQELLRDAGRDVVLSRSLIASYQFDQLSAQAWAESNTLIQRTVANYWQLYQARANYFLQMALVEWADKLFLQIQERSQHVELALNSLEQARALSLDAQAELVDARTRVLQAQDSLYRQVNDPSLDPNFIELVTVEPPLESILPFDPQFEVATAFQDRPEVRDRLAAIRETAVELRVASNQILPRLSLSLTSTLNGFDSARDFGGALGNLDQQPASATAAANFEMFLNNRTAKARNKQAQLKLSRLQIQYEDQLQAIREEVLVALRVVNNAMPKIELRSRTLASRQREIDAIAFNTWISPAEGVSMVSQLEQLFQAINRLVRTQEQLIDAKVELQIAMLELQRAKGSLVSPSLLPTDIDIPIPQPLEQLRRERPEKQPWIEAVEDRVLTSPLPGHAY